MANPEHMARIQEGVEAWNSWRHDNPGILPVLWEANLEEADLSGINLRKADLSRANLKRANLSGAIQWLF